MSAIVTLPHGAESSALAAPAFVDHAAKSQADLGLQRGHDGMVGVGGIDGIAFGMNCIVTRGEGEVLRVGQEVDIELAF